MSSFGIRQFTGLLISLSMTLIGYLGLTGTITTQSVLITVILVGVAVFPFLSAISQRSMNTPSP